MTKSTPASPREPHGVNLTRFIVREATATGWAPGLYHLHQHVQRLNLSEIVHKDHGNYVF